MPPKVHRRPAARVAASPKAAVPAIRGARRRPAIAGVDAPETFEAGGVVAAATVSPTTLLTAGRVWCTDVVYWKERTQLVGRFKSLRYDDGEPWMEVHVEGTKSEHLLKFLTGVKDGKVSVHLCPSSCGQELTGDTIVHVVKLKKLAEKEEEEWMKNLLVVGRDGNDELGLLRREMGSVSPARRGAQAAEETGRKEKQKDKERKKKEKKKRSRSPSEVRRKGGRDLAVVLGDSGLDPEPKRRKRFLRKAKRLVKKKKKKSTSASSRSTTQEKSSRSSSSEGVGAADIFGQNRMAKRIASSCPGVLTATSLSAVQEQLLTSQGQMWDLDKRELPPLFIQYFRGQLAARMQPAMRREAVHVSYCLDLGLQGKVPQLLDVLAQRLKALEGQTNGKHWSVTAQYELVPEEQGSVATAQETEAAAREAREANRLRSHAGRPFGASQEKGDEWKRDTPKGKAKGQGKGKDWRKDAKGDTRDFRRDKEDERGREKNKGK